MARPVSLGGSRQGNSPVAKAPATQGPSFPAPGPPASPGWVRLESDNGLRVDVLLGPDGARLTDGYGGWEEIGRPSKKPITHWAGGKPDRMAVQIHLDGFLRDVSIEGQVAALEQMGRRDNQAPPRIRCTLPAGLPRSPKVVWVVEGLDWDEENRAYDQAGQRTRQRVTVSLLEFIGEDLIRVSPAKARKQAKKGGGSSSYASKKGESLKSIARKFSLPLGDMKKANPKVRDASKALKAGTKVKVPDVGSKAIVG